LQDLDRGPVIDRIDNVDTGDAGTDSLNELFKPSNKSYRRIFAD
jgi:hypothetical protein